MQGILAAPPPAVVPFQESLEIPLGQAAFDIPSPIVVSPPDQLLQSTIPFGGSRSVGTVPGEMPSGKDLHDLIQLYFTSVHSTWALMMHSL